MADMEQTNAKATLGYAQCSRPTLGQRFWRAMGFRWRVGDEPLEVDGLEGWMRTRINTYFSVADRIRLLFSGRLTIDVTTYMNAPSPSVIKHRTDSRVVEPWGSAWRD